MFSLTCCEKKYDNKLFVKIFLFFGVKDHPRSHNWTLDFEPAFSQRFYFPLSPRSIFPTRQRFPIPNHVTSGCMSPPSLFPTGQRFPFPNHVTSGCMSLRSLFPTGQRFSPIKKHVTSGSGYDVTDQSEASIFSIRSYITTHKVQKSNYITLGDKTGKKRTNYFWLSLSLVWLSFFFFKHSKFCTVCMSEVN